MLQQTFPYLERKVVLEPTSLAFESAGVLNPACFAEGELIHMYYRAVREGNYSTIGYCQLRGDRVVYRAPEPVLWPQSAAEQHGLEDPRLVKCEGLYYLFYTVYDGNDAQVAYATTKHLPNFKKQQVISPQLTYGEFAELCKLSPGTSYEHLCQLYPTQDHPGARTLLWEKDTFIFPRTFGGRFALVHRLKPEIQILFFDTFEQLTSGFWLQQLADLEHHTLLSGRYWFEDGYLGGGAPPVETPAGWLFVYHAAQQTISGNIYRAGIALLDLEDPSRVLARLPYPLFEPEKPWEKEGVVQNVVFPTSLLIEGEQLHCYYGAADTRIGRISFSLPDLLTELLKHSL